MMEQTVAPKGQKHLRMMGADGGSEGAETPQDDGADGGSEGAETPQDDGADGGSEGTENTSG